MSLGQSQDTRRGVVNGAAECSLDLALHADSSCNSMRLTNLEDFLDANDVAR